MKKIWHTLTIREIERRLNAGQGGLSPKEAEKRLKEFSLNWTI